MAGSSRGGREKYTDPNSWLGKQLLQQVEDGKRRIVGHGKCKKLLTEKVQESANEYFGGHLIPKK
jgi:hypothetical protein